MMRIALAPVSLALGLLLAGRGGGGGGAPEVIQPPVSLTAAQGPGYDDLLLTIRPGDGRLFTVANGTDGLTLFTQVPGGSWQHQLLLPPGFYPHRNFQGLDASGRFYVGAGLTYPLVTASSPQIALFTEVSQ